MTCLCTHVIYVKAHLGVYNCNSHSNKMYYESDFLLYSIVHVEIIIVVIIKLYSVIIYLILRFHNPKQSKFGCWSIDLNTV